MPANPEGTVFQFKNRLKNRLSLIGTRPGNKKPR